MIDVLIVDDHAIFRTGVRRLLSDEDDMHVTGEARNGGEALALLRGQTYQVVLMDINMGARSGLDVLNMIRAEWPRQPVIMLSMYPEKQYALVALRAGANAYVSKDMESSDLVAAIRAVAGGGRYLCSRSAGEMLLQLQSDEAGPAHHRLSGRELQIMQEIVNGSSLTEIGERMFLSVKTVSTYRARILEKLDLANNAELVRYALRHGMID
ncbi:MAG: response regulator transcription factor [Zoogloea sp.]|nr:response regulator transcription factor [Zoogloea sp.]